MTKQIEISDQAYAVIIRHAQSNGETSIRAVDELVMDGADHTWYMDMPEMKKVWEIFRIYYAGLPAFERGD